MKRRIITGTRSKRKPRGGRPNERKSYSHSRQHLTCERRDPCAALPWRRLSVDYEAARLWEAWAVRGYGSCEVRGGVGRGGADQRVLG
ncbi:hypothetical protein E2C01_063044 [Portunus trituberculatus]|uniref:Uncharacterized protein n=1 Tax=Portunus trituberculatus TaxID=210409 RepID=A0A5B7HJR7_PORTR|nr:hypothetical protein [Portunus trituberculatus]